MSKPMTSTRAIAARPRHAAFTLVELMISIALALMLIYGVSQVFKLTGETVGTQQAVATSVRDQRSASATIREDFHNSLQDSPLFMISNRIAYGYDGAGTGFKAGFKNAEDERDNGPDPLPGTPINVNGTITTPPGIMSGTDRAPRLDRLAFLARGVYRSQMVSVANNAQVTTGVATADAYIWYGHVAIHDEKTNNTDQPQKQYANDRVLGRMQLLMQDSPPPPNPPPANILYPLGFLGQAYTCLRGDTVPASIEQWRQIADAAYNQNGTQIGGSAMSWYRAMLDGNPGNPQYWRPICQTTLTRPISQDKIAQTVPLFVSNCTQFIVEYAGDYLIQQENDPQVPGRVIAAAVKMSPKIDATNRMQLEYNSATDGQGDGQIDYIIDTSADPNDPPSDPTKWVRRVRWYGLPRDVTGDGRITINDVVPLADVMAYYKIFATSSGVAKRAVAPWEAELPLTDQTIDDTAQKQGLISLRLKNTALPRRNAEEYAQQDYSLLTPADAPAFRYTCAFHNAAPAMIRITMKIGDPTGNLGDGQWYQYILTR